MELNQTIEIYFGSCYDHLDAAKRPTIRRRPTIESKSITKSSERTINPHNNTI